MKKLENNKTYSQEFIKNLHLSNQTISDVEFEACTFVSCTFSEVNFSNCRFVDCTFEKCTLNLIKLDNVSMDEVLFKENKLSGIDFSGLAGISKSLEFTNSKLNYIVIADIDLEKRIFKECSIIESSFFKVNLQSADFSGSDIKGTRFEDCDLRKANFVGAKNYFIDTVTNKIAKARFSLPEATSLLKNLDIVLE
jgi:fluoroquinolone resistance protein